MTNYQICLAGFAITGPIDKECANL